VKYDQNPRCHTKHNKFPSNFQTAGQLFDVNQQNGSSVGTKHKKCKIKWLLGGTRLFSYLCELVLKDERVESFS
jgi:hypothetical protein